MVLTELIVRLALGTSLVTGMQYTVSKSFDMHPQEDQIIPSSEQVISQEPLVYGKLPACKPIKGKPAVRAKSPDVLGAEPSTSTLTCFSKADVDAGKALLGGATSSCSSCHGGRAAWNPSVMLANLRAQGDGTLSSTNIASVNAAHLPEMGGIVATAKQLKLVRAFLKCSLNG